MGAASAAACATPPRRHPVHSSSETVMLKRLGVASPRRVQGSRLSARQTQRPSAARRSVTVTSTAVGAAEGLKTRPWTGSERELKVWRAPFPFLPLRCEHLLLSSGPAPPCRREQARASRGGTLRGFFNCADLMFAS
jgi:hypothetical protein